MHVKIVYDMHIFHLNQSDFDRIVKCYDFKNEEKKCLKIKYY